MTRDLRTEARLQLQARTVFLGRVEASNDATETAGCRVEVTYAWDDRPEYPLAGYYHVVVPAFESSGHEDIDLANHPSTLADTAIVEHFAKREGIAWYEIDEVTAAW
jgi:hypothetical protein